MNNLPLIIETLRNVLGSLSALADAYAFEKGKRWLTRRWNRRPFFQARQEKGFYQSIFPDLKEDPELLFKCIRMDLSTFHILLQKCEPHFIILRKRTDGICCEERLLLTLRFLALGDELTSLSISHRISESTILEIIKSSCIVIYKALAPVYLRQPNRVVWRNISKGFYETWNMPNCLGAIDGQHIPIIAPAHSGSLYHNYKNFFSLVLLAVCNHRYEFVCVDVGAPGGESDGGIFRRSSLGIAFGRGELDFPEETPSLPGTDTKIPYYWVGDDAFGLTKHMMKPFKGHFLSKEQRIFNYRLSRARRCIENSFGILVARWRIFNKPIGMDPEYAKIITYACICLHNFLMSRTKSAGGRYCPDNFTDVIGSNGETVDGAWRSEVSINNSLIRVNDLTPLQEANEVREILKNYFTSPEGQVPWQDDYINRGIYGDNLIN